MDAKSELEAILKKQGELETIFKQTRQAGLDLKNKLAKEQGQLLFKKLDAFAKLFSSGPVKESFEGVLEVIEALEGYDSDYIGTVSKDKPYGVKDTPSVKYYAMLLSGVLRKDADLWTVLGRISDTHKQPGCPFVAGGE